MTDPRLGGDARHAVTNRPLTPALPDVLTWTALDIRPVALPCEAYQPGLRPHVLENYLHAEQKKLLAALYKQRAELKSQNNFDANEQKYAGVLKTPPGRAPVSCCQMLLLLALNLPMESRLIT